VLRVGLSGDYAPFSLERAGALTGSDVVLARRLAARLGVEVAFVPTSWPTLMADLQAGRFDVALGGVSVTRERAAVAAFSVPYHEGGKTLIAPCSAGTRFATLEAVDLPGVRVIVNPGGTNERFVRSRLKRAQVVTYPDNRGIFAALAGGAADLMVTDDVEVALQVRRLPALCRASPKVFEPASKAVLMPQDPALKAEVNGWLEDELREGVPGALLEAALAAPP
jgi:cyclohexadienyl dehydratase